MPTDLSPPSPRALPERFASVVAHEMRNPLSAVRIALQTVGHGETVSEKDMRRLNIALREVGTLERVLDLVLEWARPSAHTPARVTAQTLVDAATERAQDALEATGVVVESTCTPITLHVDAHRVAQALSELIRNGALAAPAGSRVSVLQTATEAGVFFDVTNEGAVLDEAALSRAFEPFWSGRPRGVGLGLTVANSTATLLGGSITLHPEPQGGCTARLLLPKAVVR